MAGLQTSTRGTARERDRGLARLNHLTRTAIVGATALAGVFAGVAAQSVKGRSATLPPRVSRRVAVPTRAPAPPTAPPVGGPSEAPQQQAAPAPTPAPVPTPAPPVVVSGGS